MGHGAEGGEGVGVVAVELFRKRDEIARADDAAKFSKLGGVQVLIGKGCYAVGWMGRSRQLVSFVRCHI